jgi:hypothetical protein
MKICQLGCTRWPCTAAKPATVRLRSVGWQHSWTSTWDDRARMRRREPSVSYATAAPPTLMQRAQLNRENVCIFRLDKMLCCAKGQRTAISGPTSCLEFSEKDLMNDRAFMVPAERYDLSALLSEWTWLVPERDTPLFLTVMADWVFGSPDGAIWRLSVLDGDYVQIAASSEQYNAMKRSTEWLNEEFCADWQAIAVGNGMQPDEAECLGWGVHPYLGGELKVENLLVFSMLVYQSLMGQLHRQLSANPPASLTKKPSWKFW